MKYTREGDRVTLEMSVDDWENLLIYMGYVTGTMKPCSRRFWEAINFVNEINKSNPNFTPYEIPKEFAK